MKFSSHISLILYIFLICLLIPAVKANPVPAKPLSDIFTFLFFLPYMFLAFLITLGLELVVFYVAFLGDLEGKNMSRTNLSRKILYINSLTFPLVQIFGILFARLFSTYLLLFILLNELIVILLESLLLPDMIKKINYSQVPNNKIILTTIIANLVSMVIGTPIISIF